MFRLIYVILMMATAATCAFCMTTRCYVMGAVMVAVFTYCTIEYAKAVWRDKT